MRSTLLTTLFLFLSFGRVSAHGLLIPEDKTLPPLAMVHHKVSVAIEDQVSITTVEQTFRNHTDRQLEATYLFPIPKGANVNKFTMWVDGKEQGGELLDAKKAGEVYQSIVRRTQDPGLLEYLGNNLMRLRIFPVLPKVDQKVKISFTSISTQEGGVVEYIYPMKTDGKATRTLEEFSIKATIKSQRPVQSVYSPTHLLNVQRRSDREVTVNFERNQALLDKDFQLFYSLGSSEIGITPLMHKPVTGEDGYFLLLLSPQLEVAKNNVIPRDVVLVLDTSGSMDNVKMDQARKALKHCLSNLNPKDRFGVLGFASNVRPYRDTLVEAKGDQLDDAKKWVEGLKAGGGTNIQAALNKALSMRTAEDDRTFTVVFFTDGQPTLGEMKPEKILKEVGEKNSKNTRMFTFGVGDDVNAAFLDQLADNTRAVSTYVRPAEDIEAKVSSLYGKISHPVLANVRLTSSPNVRLHDIYPIELPDLFYGSQLVVLGKYSGQGGAASVKLSGQVGKDTKEFAYDVTFPERTSQDREFVEDLWARRKVGYLLDQVRKNGEQKEVLEEILALSKRYGIATPYTSHLIVPDSPTPVAQGNTPATRPTGGNGFTGGGSGFNGFNGIGGGSGQFGIGGQFGQGGFGGIQGGGMGGPRALTPPATASPDGKKAPAKVEDFAKGIKQGDGEPAKQRGAYEKSKLEQDLKDQERRVNEAKGDPKMGDEKTEALALQRLRDMQSQNSNFEKAQQWYKEGRNREAQVGPVGVDVAVCANNLRQQDRLVMTANRVANGRNCLEIGGVWIDQGYANEMKTVVVKAQSDAYFRILEKQPKMKDVFRLGNYLVFVTPSNTALIVDVNDGKEKLADEEIDALFTAKQVTK
jgi:Ca-activated chloride channel homolog